MTGKAMAKAKQRPKRAIGSRKKRNADKPSSKIDQIVRGVKETVGSVVDTVKEAVVGSSSRQAGRTARPA
jgi:hypothetical protein